MSESAGKEWVRAVNGGVVTTDGRYLYAPHKALDGLVEERNTLQAENERLRAVLRTLLADLDNEGGRGYASAIIAREALGDE